VRWRLRDLRRPGGLTLRNRTITTIQVRAGRNNAFGPGVASGDIDNYGDLDLVVGNSGPAGDERVFLRSSRGRRG
jgi:hypothetical protein